MKPFAGRRKCIRAAALGLGLATALALVTAAGATPIADGRFDPDEGYDEGRWVRFIVEGTSTIVTGGQLWHYQDAATGDVFAAILQPRTLVDNTYGAGSIGWRDAAPSGRAHNFKDLTDSDLARFQFTDALGNVVLDVFLDYLSETSKHSDTYRSLGVTGGDGTVLAGSAAHVLAWGTSLGYNFNTLGYVLTRDSPATDSDYTENPAYPGWIFDVIYEVHVAGAAFAGAGFGEVRVPVIHDSPNKIGRNKVYPDVGDQVPEPATLGLALVGVGALLGRRKR